jgi:hypothetical protein
VSFKFRFYNILLHVTHTHIELEVTLFFRGYLFYSPKDKKVFVTINVRFREKDYVNNFKPKSEVLLEQMLEARNSTSSIVLEDEVIVSSTPQITTNETPSTILPCRNGRIVRTPDRFLLLFFHFLAFCSGGSSNLLGLFP